MVVSFGENLNHSRSALVIPVFADDSALPPNNVIEAQDASGYLAANKAFSGKAGQTYTVVHNVDGHYRPVIFLGVGNRADLDRARVEKISTQLYKAIA